MKRIFMILPLLALLLAGCAAGAYAPTGEKTGDDALDGQVLTLLEELCDPKASQEENLAAVYDWVCEEIAYRPGTADTSGGFTEALVQELAAEALSKRKGNCDSEAALMAVLLTRMGCPAQVVQGQFQREDGQMVDHAWVVAQVDGTYRHFDPLYGRYYTDDGARDYFLQTDVVLEQTHTWDCSAVPACP